MKKTLISIILFISFSTNAQNAQDIIDGLKKELKTNPDAKKTATIYSDLTYYFANISIDSALYYNKKALSIAKNINDEKIIAQTYCDIGSVYLRNGNLLKAKENYLIGLQIRKRNNDFDGIAKININLGSVYASNQNFIEATKSYVEAINYFEHKNDTISNSTKLNLAIVFYEMRNYSKALKYMKEGLGFFEKANITERVTNGYITLGNIYSDLNNNNEAYSYYYKSLKIALSEKNNLGISTAYYNIGSLKLDENKTFEALQIHEMSKKYITSYNSDIGQAVFEIRLSSVYIKNKKYIEAKKLALKNILIFKEENYKQNLVDSYKNLTEIYLNLKQNDSASFYFKLFNNHINLLTEEQLNKNTNELETKYQTAKKEKQIIQQQADAKQKNFYLISISVLAILIGLIGFLIYKQQKQKNQQIVQENNLNSAIDKIETQNKLQEQRLSISRDLHDNIGAQLTFIISSVENVKYGFDIDNPKLENKLTNISSFARETIVELRDTIWAMNHNEISYEDLEIRINNYIEKAKLSKDQISFSFAIDPILKTQKLTSVQGMNIYRTIQEAVNNAIKYANASIITVNAKQVENQNQITITDNGSGFDFETTESGNGLQNMKKRIEEIGGKFTISSNNDGTRVEILV